MKKTTIIITALFAAFFLGSFVNGNENTSKDKTEKKQRNLKLGAFSMSLNVKDVTISKEFYEKLGFTVFGGSLEQKYLIMKNGNTLIGIFQGMFEENMLTFNPGWDENAKNVKDWDDVRVIQKELKAKEIAIAPEADEKTEGPAFIMLSDPDGNMILIDQHR
jgi:catechol 2,3-dioxygenase-like lactoylglutathione lyase family enzyme